MANDFKWYGEDADPNIIIPSTQAIAVYTNPARDLVLRQEDQHGGDDSVVVIPRSAVKVIAKAMLDELKRQD